MDDVHKNIPIDTPIPSQLFEVDDDDNNAGEQTIVKAVDENGKEIGKEEEEEKESNSDSDSAVETETETETPDVSDVQTPINTRIPIPTTTTPTFPFLSLISTTSYSDVLANAGMDALLRDFDPKQPGLSPTKNINFMGGKNINYIRHLYEEQMKTVSGDVVEEEEEEEVVGMVEEVSSELRQTTKNNKCFHRMLFLEKKECIMKRFPILFQKNADLVVTAENKFREISRIYTLKKKYIEKNKEIKDIFDLELIEHRYRNEVERMGKKK